MCQCSERGFRLSIKWDEGPRENQHSENRKKEPGQVIERLRRNGQGGGKERQKVWLIEASKANMFTGSVGGKPSFRKGERRRKLEV